MHIANPLRSKLSLFRAAAENLRLWVLTLLAWVVERFGDRDGRLVLQAEIREARRHTRELLLLAACAQMAFHVPPPPGARGLRTTRPFGARAGLRYRRRRFNALKLATRGVRLRTLADLRRVLERFDAVVARVIARMPKRITGGALVLVGVVGACVRDCATDSVIDAYDTS